MQIMMPASIGTLENHDAVYDRAALIALPTEARRRYVQKMLSLIEPHAQIFLITFIYNESEMQGPPFSVDENEVKKYFGEKYNILELYKEPVVNIPVHLQAIGLKHLQELIFSAFSRLKFTLFFT